MCIFCTFVYNNYYGNQTQVGVVQMPSYQSLDVVGHNCSRSGLLKTLVKRSRVTFQEIIIREGFAFFVYRQCQTQHISVPTQHKSETTENDIILSRQILIFADCMTLFLYKNNRNIGKEIQERALRYRQQISS